MNLLWPYLVLLVLLVFWGMLSAPVELDIGRTREQKFLRDSLSKRDARIASLEARLEVSPVEQERREHVKKMVGEMNPGARDLLCEIVRAGTSDRDRLTAAHFDVGHEVLSVCEDRYKVLESVTSQRPRKTILQPTAAYREALENCLFADQNYNAESAAESALDQPGPVEQ